MGAYHDRADTRIKGSMRRFVLSPFAGIGSEIHTAVRLGRRGHGIELKPSYWRTAVNNLRDLDEQMNLPALFDEAAL